MNNNQVVGYKSNINKWNNYRYNYSKHYRGNQYNNKIINKNQIK